MRAQWNSKKRALTVERMNVSSITYRTLVRNIKPRNVRWSGEYVEDYETAVKMVRGWRWFVGIGTGAMACLLYYMKSQTHKPEPDVGYDHPYMAQLYVFSWILCFLRVWLTPSTKKFPWGDGETPLFPHFFGWPHDHPKHEGHGDHH